MDMDDGGRGTQPLPLLGELALPFPHQLLAHSVNPRMDLACLVSIDPSSTAAGAGAQGAGGGKLSATQAARARLIAMARARAIGGAAAAAAAAAGDTAGTSSNGEPKRGPPLLVGLYRMEGAAVKVWQVTLPVQPTLFEPLKTSDGKFIEEEESASVGDVAWSPDGTRLAVSLTFVRTKPAPAAGPSSQAAQTRHAHMLQILSVHDGAQLSAIATGSRDGSTGVRKLQWANLPLGSALIHPPNGPHAAFEPFSLRQIHAMNPLPTLDVAALEKVGTSQNNSMPHYMRAQQQLAGIGSAGVAAQQAIDSALPSEQARLTGLGPLARVGSLFGPNEAFENGLVGRKGKGKGIQTISSLSVLSKSAEGRQLSLLVATEDSTNSDASCAEFVLDGASSLGSTSRQDAQVPASWRPLHLDFSSSLQMAAILFQDQDLGTTKTVILHLPFTKFSLSRSGLKPRCASAEPDFSMVSPFKPALHLARLGSYMRFYLGYALDAAALCSKIWSAETGRPRRRFSREGIVIIESEEAAKKASPPATGGTAEWRRVLQEAAKNEGVDTTAELLIVLLSGRASAAIESLLLNTVTQGMLRTMEANTTESLSTIRRVSKKSILPACERIQVLASELRGCARWSQRFGSLFGVQADVFKANRTAGALRALDDLVDLAQRAVKLCHRIEEEIERELLALEEFYKWWRFERERQDYLANHKEDPHLAMVHDILTVSDFVYRGFTNATLAVSLDGGSVAEAQPTATGLPSEPSGLGIAMNAAEQSAVLNSQGRIVTGQVSVAADPPVDDEEMTDNRARPHQPRANLRHTLTKLKSQVLENRRLGVSIAPRFPLPTREHHARRMRAKQVFAGAALDFDDENQDLQGTKGEQGAGKETTLEGTLWLLARGVADVLEPALKRTMSTSTSVQEQTPLPLSALGFASVYEGQQARSVLTSRPPGSAPSEPSDSSVPGPRCLVKQRLIEHSDQHAPGGKRFILLCAYATASGGTPSAGLGEQGSQAAYLVVTRQNLLAGPVETAQALEATRFLLPAPVLSLDFYSDDELLLLLLLPPSGTHASRSVSSACTLQTLDLSATTTFGTVNFAAAAGPAVSAGAVDIPTRPFEARRSFALSPDTETALSRLPPLPLPLPSSGSGSSSGAGSAAAPSARRPSCVWAINPGRATAMSALPLPVDRVGAPASSGLDESMAAAGRGRAQSQEEGVGRLMQYWDLADLS